ncbi:uncharacterized protein [Malus domestica]|uniref:uncharacterized protein isoform X1 n=1 Tax=Malus domestica TaxID=3750 RepID=UPI0039770437
MVFPSNALISYTCSTLRFFCCMVAFPLFKFLLHWKSSCFRFSQELLDIKSLPSMKLQSWCKARTKRGQFFRQIPRSLFDLVDKCLTVNPRQRISAKEALQHEFFAPCHEYMMTLLNSQRYVVNEGKNKMQFAAYRKRRANYESNPHSRTNWEQGCAIGNGYFRGIGRFEILEPRRVFNSVSKL